MVVGDLEPIIVLGCFIGGSIAGLRRTRLHHARALPAERAQCEFVADRLVTLARAPD